MPDVYHLYLDESETHTDFNQKVFCIAGIIVKKEFHDDVLTKELSDIKELIWGTIALSDNKYILHEKDVKFAQNKNNKYHLNSIDPIYRIFKYPRPSVILHTGLKRIIKLPEITIIGACVVEDEIHRHYHSEIITEKQLIAMQVVIENFCHFLQRNNGVGSIFYESIEEKANNIIRRRFNLIEVMGTMYVSPSAIQKRIVNIYFPNKTDNVSGLQIADFIPNNIVRKVASKKKLRYNLYEEIRLARYDGGIMKRDKFGVKVIPRY